MSFQRTFQHGLPCHWTTPLLLREVHPTLANFPLLQQKYGIRTSLCIFPQILHSVCVHAKCIPSIHDQEDVGSSRSTSFFNFFHMGVILYFFPAILCHPRKQNRINHVFCEQTDIPISVLSSRPSSNEIRSNGVFHNNPAIG